MGPSAKSQAQRGDGYAAGPEPRSARMLHAQLPPPSQSDSLSLSLNLAWLRDLPKECQHSDGGGNYPPAPFLIPPPLSLSLFLLSLTHAAHTIPAAWSATMASRTSTGCMPGAGGGHRLELRPGKAASTSPGLSQTVGAGPAPATAQEKSRLALSTASLPFSTPPDAASSADGAAGQVSVPARRRSRRQARTKIGMNAPCSAPFPS